MGNLTDPRVARLRDALRDEPKNLEEGLVVADKLRLLRPLAQGGMGSVWVADHLSLRTEVAVKFMRDRGAADPQALERFGREAAAAARIKSPHVVAIHDHGIAFGDTPYIVMELLRGRDLRALLEERGRLDARTTMAVVTQVGKALAKAHSLGIVHRDVKPANVFLCDEDAEIAVKLLDFGVAKSSGDGLASTATGSTLGTPLYMSPEQILSAKTVDHRADLWSLAVVAYECLAGKLPFEGESVGAVAIAIDRGVFVPPSTVVRELGPRIDAWTARALAKDPAARFADAHELTDSLREALEGCTTPSTATTFEGAAPASIVAATLSGTASEQPRARHRRPLWVPFGAVGVLLAAGGYLVARDSRHVEAPTARTFGWSWENPPTSVDAPAPLLAPAPAPSRETPVVAVAPPHTAARSTQPNPVHASAPDPSASVAPPPEDTPPASAASAKRRDRGF